MTEETKEVEAPRKWIYALQQTMAGGITLKPVSNDQYSDTYDEMLEWCHSMNTKWAKGQTEILEPTTFGERREGQNREVFNKHEDLTGAVFYWPKLPEKKALDS